MILRSLCKFILLRFTVWSAEFHPLYVGQFHSLLPDLESVLSVVDGSVEVEFQAALMDFVGHQGTGEQGPLV